MNRRAPAPIDRKPWTHSTTAADHAAAPHFSGVLALISRFFIDRPIFAAVLSIVITLAGGIALTTLPIAMYPPISPPVVQVDCSYPGASAQVVAQTVATPIEQQVNGVENMLYMSSQCTNDGAYNLTVTFKHGVDLNMAQVLVQNRVSLAVPLLPDVIKQTGVTTRKKAPDILLALALTSPDRTRDQLYLSNYALMHLKDEIARLPGVADIGVLGQRDYSMRIWVDPEKLASRDMTAADVAGGHPPPEHAGRLGPDRPAPGRLGAGTPGPIEHDRPADRARGIRPDHPQEVARRPDRPAQGCCHRRDGCQKSGHHRVRQREAGGEPGHLPAPRRQCPRHRRDGQGQGRRTGTRTSPAGVGWEIRYDTTPFISESINEVFKTLREAIILVAVVVLLFLQNWRSALIPLVAVPVAIIGTFAVLAAMGFSLNNLTLFGLVLAIGIVVDDAIVVVEAVEHHVEHGLSPYNATVRAMEEVSGPVIAIGLVLTAVFVPCAFISGIVGQFFRQFALTIATSTVISAFNSLTLSPALAAILIKPKNPNVRQVALPRLAYMLGGGLVGYLMLGPFLLGRQWEELEPVADRSVGLLGPAGERPVGGRPRRVISTGRCPDGHPGRVDPGVLRGGMGARLADRPRAGLVLRRL